MNKLSSLCDKGNEVKIDSGPSKEKSLLVCKSEEETGTA